MIFLDDEILSDLATPADLMPAIRAGLEQFAPPPERKHYSLSSGPNGTLMVMPAWADGHHLGVKLLTIMQGNASRGVPTINGIFVIFEPATGIPKALLSAGGLTALRTAAVSALAASWLARSSAKTLLMIGTGALAPYLIRAHCAVRPIERVLIWGRDRAKAAKLAVQLSGIGCDVSAADEIRPAAQSADVISCATSSSQPLLLGDFVRPGTHIDLVGSYTPEMREADTLLIQRGRLVVDTRTAFSESGDLMIPVEEGAIAGDAPSLGEVTEGIAPGRSSDDEITIFKAVGTAIADLAAAEELLRRHQQRV